MALGDYPHGHTPLGTEYAGWTVPVDMADSVLLWEQMGFASNDLDLRWDQTQLLEEYPQYSLLWIQLQLVSSEDPGLSLLWDAIGNVKDTSYTLLWSSTGRGAGSGVGCCPPPVDRTKEICK